MDDTPTYRNWDDGAHVCEVRVGTVLGQPWSASFPQLELVGLPGGETLLRGRLPDQSALHGLLARIAALGIPLLSVRWLDPLDDSHSLEEEDGHAHDMDP